MLNPSADRLRLELGKPCGQLPHTINCFGIFIHPRDNDFRIQSSAA